MNLQERNDFIRKFFYERCLSEMKPEEGYTEKWTIENAKAFFEQKCMGELDRKGYDYSHGGKVNVDANRNFREVADKLNISVFIVWAVYFWKHIDSIFGWLRGNELKAEGIDERITDAINYLLIFVSMLDQKISLDNTEFLRVSVIKIVNNLMILSMFLDQPRQDDLGDRIEKLTTELLGCVKNI